ncbi:hypothetical protein IMZ48_04765 [Candidatus Bathyarchaeota archaeon]|nr:hypothetical protein [Candidatus Bathyarchaeota archaeon]
MDTPSAPVFAVTDETPPSRDAAQRQILPFLALGAILVLLLLAFILCSM